MYVDIVWLELISLTHKSECAVVGVSLSRAYLRVAADLGGVHGVADLGDQLLWACRITTSSSWRARMQITDAHM